MAPVTPPRRSPPRSRRPSPPSLARSDKTVSIRRDVHPGRQDYWKLTPAPSSVGDLHRELNQLNHAFLKGASPGRLRYVHSRAQRGLMSYEKRETEDLIKWCEQRRLTVPKGGYGDKRALVKLLEEADEDATFDRFQDLPPELRLQIYSMHFKDLPTGVDAVSPPIARTSRLLRQEALPVFYAEVPLHIWIMADCKFWIPQVSSSDAFDIEFRSFRPTPAKASVATFLKKAPAEVLDMTKKIHVHLWMKEPGPQSIFLFSTPKDEVCLDWELKLKKEEGAIGIKHYETWILGGKSKKEDVEGFEKRMTGLLRDELAGLAPRERLVQVGDEKLIRELFWKVVAERDEEED